MKIKAILTILISIVFSETVNGQVVLKGQVNSSSEEPIPYANIYLKNRPMGCTAFRDGHFRLQLDSLYPDSLIVSCVGFKPAKLYLPEIFDRKQLTVKLDEHQQELEEVLVKPREMKVLVMGLDKNRAKTCHGIRNRQPRARFIANSNQLEAYIKSVLIFVCEGGVYDAPFRLNLISADPITGQPSEPLINHDFILHADRGGQWVKLNLENKGVRLPFSGFFVSVQQLPLDSAQKFTYSEKHPDIPPDKLQFSAPRFGFRFEKFEEVVQQDWLWRFNEWVATWREYDWETAERDYGVKSRRHKFSTIMIKAEISYYADQELKIKEVKPKRKLRKVVDVPAPDLVKYPQSSPMDLVHSLQKATEAADFAYLFNHLLYYKNKDQLKEILPLVEELQTLADTSEQWNQQKEQTLAFLQKLESSLEQMEKSDERFFYTLNIDGAIHRFHYNDGNWRMGLDVELTGKMMEPPGSIMEEATH